MDWIEVSLTVDGEAAEAVADVLRKYGHQGVLIEQAGFEMEVWPDEIPPADELIVRAYFPANEQAETKQQQLREAIWHMSRLYPMPEPEFKVIQEENWAEAWKVHYKPLRLGRHLYIRPQWITETDAKPDEIVLVLDPGTAFGSGTHPTTQLCLIAIEDMLADWPGINVLDLGCGSGILGIAALKLGAAHVLGVDIDDLAIKATTQNATYNEVQDRITTQEGGLEAVKAQQAASGQQFDLLLCNILAKVIIQLCADGLGETVRPGGKAIFSGIIDTQADEVEVALRAAGLEPTRRRLQKDWVVIEAQKAQ
ncbi:MAG: 50S ribosomal protein L11 methyltransferase [Anaerolineae bacterium]|nr:50S ribosomal protein L11 methyltransferase [Anaerolineae bacterium]